MFLSKPNSRPPELTNPEGEIVQELLGLQVGKAQSHSLAEVTIPPGKSSTAHYHRQSEESYLILSGEGTLIVNQVSYPLTPGDAVLIQPLEIHQLFNAGPAALVFIAVCVRAWQPDDSFEPGGPEA